MRNRDTLEPTEVEVESQMDVGRWSCFAVSRRKDSAGGVDID